MPPHDPFSQQVIARGSIPGEPVAVHLKPIPPWLRRLVQVMDSAFHIPGTNIRIGLDPILGLIPGLGDVLTALPAVLLVAFAVNRVPIVIVARMLLNVGLDSLLGTVPLVGDIFDVAFRTNERNLALLDHHFAIGKPPGAFNYLVVGVAIAAVLGLALLPFLLIAWLLHLFV
jgi:Domain of unknown function (DUF4112)